jgi:beta-glucosidase
MSNPVLVQPESQVDRLLAQLSLEQKVGQMTQLTITSLLETNGAGKAIRPFRLKSPEILSKYQIGSVLNTPQDDVSPLEWRELINYLQSFANQGNTKIPMLYGIDSIHGANYVYGATLFPQPIAQAASWNLALTQKIAEISASETRASGIPWNFSPSLDVARNPLWPRMWETFGEDVFLVSEMGKATLAGYQGESLNHPYQVAACLKHFLGYGASLSGKDRTPAWIPERQLREIYLPPFAAAIEAGAASIMVNSGQINGIPVHADPFLLTDILRGELGFKGVVLSDWKDIQYLHTYHRVAKNQQEAVKMAIDAGIDMSMVPEDVSFYDTLLSLVKSGEISEKRLDESVNRILNMKFQLGLFKQHIFEEEHYADFGSDARIELSKQAVRESITLLKNEEDILPLPKNAQILLTGMAAHAQHILNGGWTHTWQNDNLSVATPRKKTILTAITELIGSDMVSYSLGTNFDTDLSTHEAVSLAQYADYIVVCLGEKPYTEFYGNINDLSYPEAQLELVEALAETGKPIIAVMVQGRPRLFNRIEPLLDGILYAYLPGDEGGEVIAETLFGFNNPGGKLPFSYPKHPHNLLPYDHVYADTISPFGEPYEGPLYPLGHGLSYTSFAFSDLSLSTKKLQRGQELKVSVQIKNTGDRSGAEVVQLYLHDKIASIAPALRKLKRFEKVYLEVGEEKTVHFNLNEKDLAFVGRNMEWVTETGEFEVIIGELASTFEWKN